MGATISTDKNRQASSTFGGFRAIDDDMLIYDVGNPPKLTPHTLLDRTVTYVLGVVSWLIIIVTFPFSMFFCFRVVREYERVVVFRLGSLATSEAQGPGLFFILPCIDTFRIMDLRTVSYDVPPQEILSADSVTVTVDAVLYFRLFDPTKAVTNVNDAFTSTKLLAQTTFRNVLGVKTLAEMLSDRQGIAILTQKELDKATIEWGVKVERLELKDLRLPQLLTRAMAAEAEAARTARAQLIYSEGEKVSSQALNEAAFLYNNDPIMVKLRNIQTMHAISEHCPSTIIFPINFPMELYLPERFYYHNGMRLKNLNDVHKVIMKKKT